MQADGLLWLPPCAISIVGLLAYWAHTSPPRLDALGHAYGSRRGGLGESEAAAARDRPADGGVDTENDGYPHDVGGSKSATLHGGRGSWRTAPSIAVRPQPHEIVPGSLPAADVALVSRWIGLNLNVIIDIETV